MNGAEESPRLGRAQWKRPRWRRIFTVVRQPSPGRPACTKGGVSGDHPRSRWSTAHLLFFIHFSYSIVPVHEYRAPALAYTLIRLAILHGQLAILVIDFNQTGRD